MRSRSRLTATWTATTAAAAAFSVFAIPAGARAADCTTDSQCGHGYTCQTTGIGGCPACPPNAACACAPAVLKTCELAPCTKDSDCATGDVCHTETYSATGCASVAGPACAPGAKCPPTTDAPDAASCTTTTTSVSTCTPKYNLPCAVDSDCGDHFTCVADVSTTCSGGGAASGSTSGSIGAASGLTTGGGVGIPTPIDAGVASVGRGAATGSGGAPTSNQPPTPAVDGGSAPVEPGNPYTPSCTTTTLATSHCEAKAISCTSDPDCPATWTCMGVAYAVSGGSVSSVPCVKSVDVDGAIAVVCDEDGGMGASSPEDAGSAPPPSAPDAGLIALGQCSPPNYTASPRDATLNGATSQGSPTGDFGTSGTVSGSPPATPETPGPGAGGGSMGTASGSSSGAASAPHSVDDHVEGGGVGCQTGGARGGASDGALFGLFACIGLVLRRRAAKIA